MAKGPKGWPKWRIPISLLKDPKFLENLRYVRLAEAQKMAGSVDLVAVYSYGKSFFISP